MVARVYGMLGSEKVLIGKLRNMGIQELGSLREVEEYIKTSEADIEKKREKARAQLNAEIERLKYQKKSLLKERQATRYARMKELDQELADLQEELEEPVEDTRNPFLWLYRRIRRWRRESRRSRLENHFIEEVDRPFKSLVKEINNLETKIQHYEQNPEKVIDERLKPHYERKKRIDEALDTLGRWIAGAKGELETFRALSKLPDDYCVINDVRIRPKRPLKSKYGGIVSCQIDHVVVGPSGVFNIESKYWSQETVDSKHLFSPAKQVMRSGRGLFVVLQRRFRSSKYKIIRAIKRKRKIRVRNVLSVMGAYPVGKVKYVKVLRPEKLPGYIQYFNRNLYSDEVSKIARWLKVQSL